MKLPGVELRKRAARKRPVSYCHCRAAWEGGEEGEGGAGRVEDVEEKRGLGPGGGGAASEPIGSSDWHDPNVHSLVENQARRLGVGRS